MVPSFAYLNQIKMSDLRKIITKTFNEVLEQTNPEHKVYDKLDDDLVLLDSGLDSLGFAILVALLDEELGYDPFQIMEEPIYPTPLSLKVDFRLEPLTLGTTTPIMFRLSTSTSGWALLAIAAALTASPPSIALAKSILCFANL